MPYNYKGDLYKREIVKKLQDIETNFQMSHIIQFTNVDR